MASEVDWSSMGGQKNSGNGNRVQFIKFQPDKGKTLRPVGKAVSFYKFFIPSTKKSVVVDPEHRNEAAAKLSAHFGQEIKPSLKYAINVIDREDNQVKILEGGQQIFEHFANWSMGNGGIPPGGNQGMDWQIIATGAGLARKYIPTPLRQTPLTTQEIDKLKSLKEHYSLKEVYKGVPMSDLLDKATGNSSDNGPDDPQIDVPAGAAAISSQVKTDDPVNW